ncbi:hypothetical protein [Sphingomonas sp. T9W2]|uniref:hypothetical protein n=1 Tax=Sphingomonas sp. T9W2 TaxID=3143183 RepID=UPI0031F5C3EA
MDTLSIWTITANPNDYPGQHVARRHVIMPAEEAGPTDDLRIADNLDQVREQLPAGLVNLGREPTDDPVIVESWI